MKCKVIVFFLYLLTQNMWASTHHPEAFLVSIKGTKDEAQKIVQHYCATCHAPKPMIPLGAPRIGFSADWQPRLKQGSDTLFKHTNEGYGLMPARGGCFECSDHQLLMAIEYMLSNSIKK